MEVSYNLKYQKTSFSSKVLIDKEGEIVIYSKGFRLKGKGAGDRGELLNFAEIKEFYYRDEKVVFVTFEKEKYTLSSVGTLFEQMVSDLYKSRNEFLIDGLFMKRGPMRAEYEGSFQRLSKFGKLISKDQAVFRLYDRTLVIIPPRQDAFSIDFNFINSYEFEEFEYQLKMVMDGGTVLLISQLGNDFEFFQEKFEGILGAMYQEVVNEVLRVIFPHFHATTLLKLAYLMKGGKAVSMYDLRKIDKELAAEVRDYVLADESFKAKIEPLMDLAGEEGLHFGLAKDIMAPGEFVRWVMLTIPEKNLVVFSILPRELKDQQQAFRHNAYFYRIIMEEGNPGDKLEDKIAEVNQALVQLNFVKDPCYKDKRDLKHSPYQYAIRKLAYLRILRKSLVGKVGHENVDTWRKMAEELLRRSDGVGTERRKEG